MLLDLFLVGIGAIGLMLAADRLVFSSGDLAARIGVSPVIIGAVVIGFGSSLPEMLVSLAALDQVNGLDLALGNVVGSNIANVALVLGASVLFFPFRGTSVVVKREGMLMMVSLVMLAAFAWNQTLDRWEGGLLLLGLVGAGVLVVRWSRRDGASPGAEPVSNHSTLRLGIIAVISLTVLALAARVLVFGAEGLALEFGLNEGLVGLTILALGTSLPELVTAFASARQGRNDLVLGNVLGSNMFNSFGVAGMSGLVGAGALANDFRPDLLMMLGVAVFAGVAGLTGDRLRRVEGTILLAAYPAAVWLAAL